MNGNSKDPARATAAAAAAAATVAAPFDAVDLGRFSQRLAASGFATFDGISGGTGWASHVAQEIEGLHAAGLLETSLNKLTTERGERGSAAAGSGGSPVMRGGGEVVPKRHVFELDLVVANRVVAAAALDRCPAISDFVISHGPKLARRLNKVHSSCGVLLHSCLRAQSRATHHVLTARLMWIAAVGGCRTGLPGAASDWRRHGQSSAQRRPGRLLPDALRYVLCHFEQGSDCFGESIVPSLRGTRLHTI